jgi:hypothetical protein
MLLYPEISRFHFVICKNPIMPFFRRFVKKSMGSFLDVLSCLTKKTNYSLLERFDLSISKGFPVRGRSPGTSVIFLWRKS